MPPTNPITILEGWSGAFGGRSPRRRFRGFADEYEIPSERSSDAILDSEYVEGPTFNPNDYTNSVSIPESWRPPRSHHHRGGGKKRRSKAQVAAAKKAGKRMRAAQRACRNKKGKARQKCVTSHLRTKRRK